MSVDLYGIPEYFSGGVMEVHRLGGDVVRLVMFRGLEDGHREPILSVVMPACAVGEMIDHLIIKVGPRPMYHDAERRLAS